MPRFEFHPEAAHALDERGNALLSKVVGVTPKPERRGFASQRVPAAVITEADIVGRVNMEEVDEYKSQVMAVRFEGPQGVAGLEEEDVKELDRVAQLALKYLHAGRATSLHFLRKLTIDWLQERFRSEITASLPTVLLERLTNAVALRTILIPIANLSIEEDLPFGPVVFKVITAEMVTSWYDAFRSSCPPEQLSSFELRFDRLRKEVQGLAAVAYTVEADEEYACEQCLEKAEQAVALLRVLHPANTSPHMALYVRPLGSENLESYQAYRYEAGAFKGRRGGARPPLPSLWQIPKEVHGQRSLQNLISLFATEERTDFQQRLFDALLIYSRNNVAKEPAEKLIFCLVAIESMLLRDPSEPIQDNIAERMAYLLGKTPEERLQVETLVKQVYAARSKFVHHGQRPTDMDTLARFMQKAWRLFFHFVFTMSVVKTKDEMMAMLKRMKYR
jgi:hypothetical protein